MKRLIFALALACALPACVGFPGPSANPPAPLAQTTIDEKGLIAAYQAFDVALSAVDALVATRVIVPGSHAAIEIKGYLETARNGLNAARAAREAGSATDYATALASAQSAMRLAASAIRKGN